jgi:hypothetical protein
MMKKKFVISQSLIANPSFVPKNSGIFTDEIENLPYKFKDSLIANPSFKTQNPFDEPKYDLLEAAKEGIQKQPYSRVDFDFEGYEQKARNAYQEKLQKHQKEADALLNKREYKDLTKTILTKDMFDNNLAAVKVEIDRVKKLIPNGQKQLKDYNNRLVSVAEYKTTLEQQAVVLESKQKYENIEASSAVSGSAAGPLGIKPSESSNEWQGRADIESLQRLIRQRQENIADIESFIFGLVSGVDQFSAFKTDIAHTNAKFIKIAEDDMLKKADEEIEDYYNELYEDSEGSPDFGTALEHPKETRNELTTKIHQHRFKKK